MTCPCGDGRCPGDGGGYYVTVVDGPRWAALLGPYDAHTDALANVERGRTMAEARNPKAHFMAFGTARSPQPLKALFS